MDGLERYLGSNIDRTWLQIEFGSQEGRSGKVDSWVSRVDFAEKIMSLLHFR